MNIKNKMNIVGSTTHKLLKKQYNTTASLYPTISLSFHCSKHIYTDAKYKCFCMKARHFAKS